MGQYVQSGGSPSSQQGVMAGDTAQLLTGHSWVRAAPGDGVVTAGRGWETVRGHRGGRGDVGENQGSYVWTRRI